MADRRVSHLASAQAYGIGRQNGVRRVKSRDGMVTILGPTFAEMEEPKIDPTANLLAELEQQKRARSST